MTPEDVDKEFRDIVTHLAEDAGRSRRGLGKRTDDPYYYTEEGYRFLKTASIYYTLVFFVGMGVLVSAVPLNSAPIGILGFFTSLWGLLKFLDAREKYVLVRRTRWGGGLVQRHRNEFQL